MESLFDIIKSFKHIMFLFGHLGVTLGVFIALGYLVPQIRGRVNYWYVAFGAILPDVIDKLIGRVLFAYSLASGRLIAHTLIFTILLALLGWKFPRGIPENWLDYFLVMFRKSCVPDFSYDFIFETIGFIFVMLFILAYLFSRAKTSH